MTQLVEEYYAGKSIFITGATGFLGKVLVEKLLRSCPGIKTIYLLLRQKRELTSEERLRELCESKLFEPLKQKQPEVLKKLKLVAGDIVEEELGLSNDDREELQKNCNVVFHSAACVRFDLKLKDAVNINTVGTYRVLKLAETMEKLEVLVHFSTAYCRCELDVLEEKLYPAVHKPSRIMDMVNWMDDDMLSHLEPKLLHQASEPNTYAYTKAITEDLVAEYGSKFPVAIARPSIVTPSLKEPLPGWVDNINGPTGLIIGSGKGVIRSMHCEPSYSADAMPVDVVANGCILLAYATAIDKAREARFYNITLSRMRNLSWGELIEMGRKLVNEYPFTVALWYPGGSIKSYWLTHQICVVFAHYLAAYIIDTVLFLFGRKTFMVSLQKRISHGLNVLQYYTTKEWYFRNTNFVNLRKRISESDNNVFYTDVMNVNITEYLKTYILGARMYCCNDRLANLPRARKLHRMRYYADKILKFLLYFLLTLFLYLYCDLFTSLVKSVDRTFNIMAPTNRTVVQTDNV